MREKGASLALVLVVVSAALASAAWAAGAVKLKGQILVSDQPVPTFDDETKMADILKKWQKGTIEREKGAESWSFHMMIFPDKKPGVTQLSLLFYDVSGSKRAYLTSKDISCDAAAEILASDIDISEEDGIKPGMKVELSLAKIIGDKQQELAKTKLTFK